MSIAKRLLGAAASAAIAAFVVVAAAGGHADHPATEDRAGPVERRALAPREAVMTDAGPRFRAQPDEAYGTTGGADPREE